MITRVTSAHCAHHAPQPSHWLQLDRLIVPDKVRFIVIGHRSAMARQYKPISGIFILLVRPCLHRLFEFKSLLAQVGAFLGYSEKDVDRRNMVHAPLLFDMLYFPLTADCTQSPPLPPPPLPPPSPHSPVQLRRHCPGRIVVILPLRMAAQTCVNPFLLSISSLFARY
jgi:hypothetical protein